MSIMKRVLCLLLSIGFGSVSAAQWLSQSSGTTARLRGVCAVDSKVAWASGNNGTYLKTTDGGATWHAGTVPGPEDLDFRDVEAFDANTAYLLSIGEGGKSRIYKTTDGGGHWTLQFVNTNPKAFFDAMAFGDVSNGIALSDPVDGRFVIIKTTDGGERWREVPRENVPPALAGEAAFAASGTCLTVQGKDRVWFGTGGGAARVFRSTDGGNTWRVAATPIFTDGPSSGIFSIAFKDAKNGVVVGGDYRKETEARDNIAVTTDGGRTWKLVKNSPLGGFRSAVAYIPGAASSTLVAVGPSGSDHSSDNGRTWKSWSAPGYHAVSFAGPMAGWAVGEGGRVAKYIGAGQ